MRVRHLLVAAVIAAPLPAQSIMGALHQDLNQVQKKFIDLANAMPEASYSWTPGPGVRSVREVFLHVASDNYLIPIFMGMAAPPATKITSDYATATAFEKRPLTKAQVIAELTESFTHAHKGLGVNTDANLGEPVKMFGQDFTRVRAAVLMVTHLHEHLGQAIAYARSNKVVPPWSQ